MFSLDKFYYILYKNLLEPINLIDISYYPFGTADPNNLITGYESGFDHVTYNRVYFYDQEPISQHLYNQAFTNLSGGLIFHRSKFPMLANSEYSKIKDDLCQQDGWYDWYYFFHGFAALSWYNNFQYIPQCDPGFTKVFINLNHLITQDRSYRMHLVASMIEKEILDYGLVSLPLSDTHGNWKTEIFSPNSKLSVDAKKLIYKHISPLKTPLVADTNFPKGWMSAEINVPLSQSALWHVVSETVYYQEKLHLTEKTFKPIVVKRPFILVAAPGNLAYLKSYGFKTFDRWIDESYDQEPDPDRRIEKIILELKRLCSLSMAELQQMHREMQPILEHNFRHLYTDFKTKIVHEMVDNFEVCIKQHNTSRLPELQIPAHSIDFDQVKRRLLGIW